MEQELDNVNLVHWHQRVFMLPYTILDLHDQKIQERAQICGNYAFQISGDHTCQYTRSFRSNY